MVRVPRGRLELRLCDSACNPYLAAAATIVAGLDGIENEIDPGEPHNFNHYDLSHEALVKKGIGVLPQSLQTAIAALEEDTLFADQLGHAFIKEFIDIKNMEWIEYQRHVSDWEVNRYLQFFLSPTPPAPPPPPGAQNREIFHPRRRAQRKKDKQTKRETRRNNLRILTPLSPCLPFSLSFFIGEQSI